MRCFAMLCIIVYHMLCLTIEPMATNVMAYRAMQIPLHIGVPLFFMISGYFNIQFSLRGLMRYCSKVWIYFIPLTVISAIFIDHESFREIFRLFFIFGHDKHWYVNCYLYLFLFSPVINRYLKNISPTQRIYLLAILLFMSVYVGDVMRGDKYLVEGKNLTNVLLFYVLGDTIRCYQKYWVRLSNLYLILAIMFFNATLVAAYFQIPSLSIRIWNYSFPYNSPLMIVNSVMFFVFFAKNAFCSGMVNWLSNGIFACYLLQCVPLTWKYCFDYPARLLYSGGANLPWAFLPSAFIYALFVMFVINVLDNALKPLCDRLCLWASSLDEKWNTKRIR